MSEVDTKEKVRLDFNAPHITYKDAKGNKVAGVTTAIGVLAKPALIPWAYKRGKDGLALYESKDKSANIGTITHAKILAYYAGYEIDNSNISPEIWDMSERCMQSFYEWAKSRNVKPILMEKPMVSEKYGFGGTPDLYGEMDGELTLLDFKSGSDIYDDYFMQLAAYRQLLEEQGYYPEKIVILNIPKTPDDAFSLKSMSAYQDAMELHFKKFLKCVDIWHINEELKKYKKGGLD